MRGTEWFWYKLAMAIIVATVIIGALFVALKKDVGPIVEKGSPALCQVTDDPAFCPPPSP